jgi:hypothetical protein
MKKNETMALLLCTLLVPLLLQAQSRVYVNGFGGYTFAESFTVSQFSGTIKGNAHFGGSVEVSLPLPPNAYGERTIELGYLGMASTMEGWTFVNNSWRRTNDEVYGNYVLIGANNYFGRQRKAMAFGGASIGMGWMNNRTKNRNTDIRFAYAVRGGGRFMLSEKVGLKVYAQLHSIAGGVGGGFYFGTGGTGAGFSAYSTLIQFGMGGALTVDLGGQRSRPASPAPNPRF